jgi:5-methylthioadenosine/S-adenosylhomocysteine deaminase
MNLQDGPSDIIPPPDVIVEGGTLLSMAEGVSSPLPHARVVIKDGRILEIGNSDDPMGYAPGAEIIQAEESLILPGLVNAHTHTAMTLFRGLADDLPLKEWLFEKVFPAEAAHINEETVYWGVLLGCLEMIASGTTTFSDGYFLQDRTVRAVEESGLRALVAQGIIDFPAPGMDDPKENLSKGREFLLKWRGFSDRIYPGLFCHSSTTCSDHTLRGAMEISGEFSAPLQIHLSETDGEVSEMLKRTGERPAVHLDRLGILNRNLIAVHAIHLDPEEMDLLCRGGVRVVHTPESNMKLASGTCRAWEMIGRGLHLGLGTDGCASNNDLDLFREMDVAAKLQKVYCMEPTHMDAGTVLKMATSWGAGVLGLDGEIGTIEKGKKADVIVVDMNRPHMAPLYNPVSNLVYSACGADVKDVIVDGKVLMKDRAFQTLDPVEIMSRVRKIAEDIRA